MFIFGKALEFDEYKQAPVVLMQNLAAQQYKVCQSPGTSLIEKEVVSKLSDDKRQLIEELAEHVNSSAAAKKKEAMFDRVLEAVKTIAKQKVPNGENVFELYGEKLGAACLSYRFEYGFFANQIEAFCNSSKFEITKKWVQAYDYCQYQTKRRHKPQKQRRKVWTRIGCRTWRFLFATEKEIRLAERENPPQS